MKTRNRRAATQKNVRRLLRLLLAAGLLLALNPPAFAQKRAAARTQFEKAEKLRTALQGMPQKERSEGEYKKAVSAYRRVYLISPQASEVTSALLTAAELYQEMGRLFDDKYYQSAIDAYQFLLHEYPTSRYRDDALFTIGQIQHEDIGDHDLAEKTFQEFLKRYPKSSKAEQAREALEEIAADREKEKKPAAKKELAEEREQQSKLPQVTSICHWNADNYTRVVIDIDDAVKFRADRIANPDRIYFDVYKAKLSSTLAGKTLEVENGFLKTIRVAQNQAGVVRVVLEVDKVKDYSVFFLPNPFRMVVDVFGESVTAAKTESKAPAVKSTAEAAPPAKAEKNAKAGKQTPVEIAKVELPTTPVPSKSANSNKPALKQESEKVAEKRPETAEATPEKPEETVTPRRGSELAKSDRPSPPPSAQPKRDGQLSITRALGLKIGRIVIDAGHGGHDTGTIGPTGLMEKDLCLDVALKLGKLIKERLPGTEIIYTREDDSFVPLENRTAIANQERADLFISIHANSSRERSARGVETYYLNFASSEDALEVAARENALSQSSIHEMQDLLKKIARNEKIEESQELAAEIQESLSKRLQKVSRAKNRGVKKAPFVVLIGANMPSVLSEISFLSNPTDESLLKKNDHRNRVAEGLFKGIENYLQNLNSLSYIPTKLPEPER